MTSLNKDTFAAPERHARPFPRAALTLCFFIVAVVFTHSQARIYSRASFPVTGNGSSDSSVQSIRSAVALSIERYESIKVFGDSMVASNRLISSFYPDAIANADSIFTFFWADQSGINKREYQIQVNQVVPLAPASKIGTFSAIDTSYCYLHSEKGKSGYLVAYATNSRVMLINGNTQLEVTPNQATIPLSLGAATQDTFFLVYVAEAWQELKLAKVYAAGNDIRIIDSITVDSFNAVSNPSVAVDSNGTVLVTWCRGGQTIAKNVYCRAFSPGLVALQGATLLASNAGRRSDWDYYDYAPLCTYGTGRFAAASWDSAGVQLHLVSVSGSSVSVQTSRIVAQTLVRHVTIASHKRYLLVACKGDVNNNGFRGVEGFRYRLVTGTPDLQNGEYFTFSTGAADTARDRLKASLNCAVDTLGNFALIWRQGSQATCCIFAEKGIRHRRGFWTSPVESLSVASGDSIRFYHATVTSTSLSSWYLEDSIRSGCSPAEFTPSKPWVSLSSDALLSAARTTCRYFQFRMTLNRNAGADSITSPLLTAISIPWNAKPVIMALDSVQVNGVTRFTVHFDSTVTLFSRSDALTGFVRLHDADSTDAVVLRTSWPAIDTQITLQSNPSIDTAVRFNRLPQSDTTVICTFSALDTFDWASVRKAFTIRTRNALPLLDVHIVSRKTDGSLDTAALTSPRRFGVQEDDSIAFLYEVSDTNDSAVTRAYLRRTVSGVTVQIDSTASGSQRRFSIRGSALPVADSLLLEIRAVDPDTQIVRSASVAVNHLPHITMVSIDGNEIRRGDTVRVNIGRRAAIQVSVSDTDLAFGDTITCTFATRAKRDSLRAAANEFSWNLLPERADTLVSVVAHDRYGRRDSMRFFLKYPWLALDSAANPRYRRARDSLDSALSLIIGSNDTASVVIPLVNGGGDTMHLSSISFLDASGSWLSVGVRQGSSVTRFKPSNAATFTSVLMRPDSMVYCTVYVTAESFTGDSVISGRFVLGTSDFAHRFDTILVRLEYNDLPVITSVAPDWDSTRPFTIGGLAKTAAYSSYRFPPHASVRITFSEPVDSASAKRGVHLYSIYDSIATDSLTAVRTRQEWNGSRTELKVFADYTQASPHFNLMPPRGLFVPTDSLRLRITADVVDRASTPHGPNRLDIDRDFSRDSSGDTLFDLRVDSVTFCVLAVSPADNDTAIGRNPSITLTFSAPVLETSVDRALGGNRSLVICSRYSNGAQIAYDSITVTGNIVRYYPATRFFYRDSVFCTYRGRTIRNRVGFPADNTGDGIPITLFDTLSMAEDITWRFRIKTIAVVSVTPKNGDTVTTATMPIAITFSEPVPSGAFDTSHAGNRSIQVRSRYGGTLQSTFRSITYSLDRRTITVIPAYGYYSNDSLQCVFFGFANAYHYDSSVFPGSLANGFSGMEWYFKTFGTGFYTYPNPYKPGHDPRHCRDNGPCGIWFKNIHTLTTQTTDFRIRIFSMKSLPVYDTKSGGDDLNFTPGKEPQWLWDTRNQRGDLVASGLYFYIVYDALNKALVKGKMLIVR
jgi:hypothetical protein